MELELFGYRGSGHCRRTRVGQQPADVIVVHLVMLIQANTGVANTTGGAQVVAGSVAAPVRRRGPDAAALDTLGRRTDVAGW